MFSKINILEIIFDGLKLLKGKTKTIPFILFCFIIPLVISLLFIGTKILIDKDIISDIISSISLFSGLLFSVIFILTENYSARRTHFSTLKIEDEDKKYLARYKEFTENTSTLILFSVAIAIIAIITLFSFSIIAKADTSLEHSPCLHNILQTLRDKLHFLKSINKLCLLNVIQVIISVLLFNYLLTILIIIKEVYAMVYDDINSQK